MNSDAPQAVRTLLVSDVHLGSKHAQAKEFLAFLRSYQPENLYLVGDFIDGWKFSSGWCWPEICDEIVAQINQLIENGTRVFYTPGNHDAFLRQDEPVNKLPAGLENVEVADEFVFETESGWRFLVTHGDLFDFVEEQAQWLSKVGGWLYDSCLSTNRWANNRLRGGEKNPYGVCGFLKGRVKRIVKFISKYERKIKQHAESRLCDGVICGHIHTPVIKAKDPIFYLNTGDWIENCTGLVEYADGMIELVSTFGKNSQLTLPPKVNSDSSIGLNLPTDESTLPVGATG